MLTQRELFVSAVTSSLVSPISKEISEEARLIILKHIHDTFCNDVSNEEWIEIYNEIKSKQKMFEDNALHGIIAHVNGVKINPKKLLNENKPSNIDLEKISHKIQDQSITNATTIITSNQDAKTSPVSGMFNRFRKKEQPT